MLATILMAVVMAACGVGALWLPFLFKIDGEKLEFLSYISSGIILGTAFALVLPECYESFGSPTVPGALILLGFMGMLLLENLFESQPNDAETGNATRSSSASGSQAENFTGAGPTGDNSFEISIKNPKSWFAKVSLSAIGMTIHSAADGIALGVTNGNSQLIVFIAIMLHKAPAAFGLTSVLLSQKQPHDVVKRDVVLFSLAGPVLAVILSIICFLLGYSADDESQGGFPGWCLALSGGTFVYVAVHLLENKDKSLQKWGLVFGGLVFPVCASLLHD